MDLHEFVSLSGLGIAFFHGLIVTGDRFIQSTPLQVLLPFSSQSYKPFWVGIRLIAFLTWGIIASSFYMRKKIGRQTWRGIHTVSFVVYAMALVHGIASGTDSGFIWAGLIYWISGGSLLFWLIYRVLASLPGRRFRPNSVESHRVIVKQK